MARGTKELANDKYELSEVFDFDDEALALNRRGRLSDAQQTMLNAVDRGTSRWTWIAAAFILVSIGGLAAVVISQTDGQREPVIAAMVVAGVALVLFAGAVLRGMWARRDLRARRITALEGPIRRKVKRHHDGILERYYLTVGRTKMLLSSRQQLEAFNADGHYLIHIVRFPGAPIVLSATRVR